MRDCWSGKAVIWIIGKYATKFAGLCGELCVCLGAGSGNEAFARPDMFFCILYFHSASSRSQHNTPKGNEPTRRLLELLQ